MIISATLPSFYQSQKYQVIHVEEQHFWCPWMSQSYLFESMNFLKLYLTTFCFLVLMSFLMKNPVTWLNDGVFQTTSWLNQLLLLERKGDQWFLGDLFSFLSGETSCTSPWFLMMQSWFLCLLRHCCGAFSVTIQANELYLLGHIICQYQFVKLLTFCPNYLSPFSAYCFPYLTYNFGDWCHDISF